VVCTAPDACSVTSACTDNVTGCVYTPKVCPVQDQCNTPVLDPTAPGCCAQQPINCTGSDKCLSYGCNPTGGCYNTSLCRVGDKCSYDICTSNGCSPQTTKCISPDLCSVGQCDPVAGCIFSAKPCIDNDPCTVDSCDAATGNCTFIQMVCNDGLKCTNDTCVAGQCVFAETSCDDGIDCTLDGVCDEAAGGVCPVKTAQSTLCADKNPCKIWSCDVTLGCVSVNYTCPTTNSNNCTSATCFDWTGCTYVPKICTLANDTQDCTTATCDISSGNCTFVDNPCATLDTAAIIGAALSGAAVVGIVIALAACIGLSGGASYAVYQNYGDGQLGNTQNNPLFKPSGNSRQNPLFRESDSAF